jgi:RNA polymerase sigma-70 factor (ECF subfamily)
MEDAVAVATHAEPAAYRAAAVPSAEELCARYANRVFQFACMVAGDDIEAEDLAQAALERAIRALPRFDPSRGEMAAWLWRIVVNVARDAGRAARRRRHVVERLILRYTAQQCDDIPLGIADEDLLAAVRRLNPAQRAVIALRFGADLDHQAVGAALGISGGAARVATHRALRRLRANLLEERS